MATKPPTSLDSYVQYFSPAPRRTRCACVSRLQPLVGCTSPRRGVKAWISNSKWAAMCSNGLLTQNLRGSDRGIEFCVANGYRRDRVWIPGSLDATCVIAVTPSKPLALALVWDTWDWDRIYWNRITLLQSLVPIYPSQKVWLSTERGFNSNSQ